MKGHVVIELKNVAYSYGGGELLTDISLKLGSGSFYFLTGPSGAGKTTFLKLCHMELAATAGYVNIFGKETRLMNRDEVAQNRQRIGFVHQDCQFLEHLNISTNIMLPILVSGRKHAGAAENLESLLNWVGLENHGEALPAELSGGERQRAALARALILSPDVILADEPTGNVDWEMSGRILNLLIELNKMGKTIMIATHDMNLIRTAKSKVNARVLRISNRRLQLAGADL